ncbi:MAG: sporulation integral membrane protein YtvI [Lawsonibacter sp.]|nr:sporulation integral membrane protein YtvI [Lawsonibacter sp.]
MIATRQLSWRERGAIWLRLGVRLGLTAGALWLLARYGRLALALSAPFLAALGAAVLLNPLVRAFQRRMGLSRQVSSLVLLLLLFGLLGTALGWLAYGAASELVSLAENWDQLAAGARALLERLDQGFRQLAAALPIPFSPDQGLSDLLLEGLAGAIPALGDMASYLGSKAVSVSSFLVGLVFFVMATYFLTADLPYLRSRAAERLDEGALHVLSQLRHTALGAFGGYLKAQLLLSVGVFVLLLAGFLLIRQPYGLLLALGLAILDFIPIVGSGTVMVPWSLLALCTRDYAAAARILALWGAIVLFRQVMEPKFVGDQTGLSPFLSLVGIYTGMKLAGVLGMVLAPIALLVVLNLAGMGVFRGLRLDLTAAFRDLSALLAQRPEEF